MTEPIGITGAVSGHGGHGWPATVVMHDVDGRPLAWQAGPVLGTSVHGMFESPAVLKALFGARVRSLDDSFDALADLVEEHFKPGLLDSLLAA